MCAVFRVQEAASVGPPYPEGAAPKVQGLNARCRWRELKPKHVRAGPSWPMILAFYSIFRQFTVSAPLNLLYRLINSLEMPLALRSLLIGEADGLS